MKRSSHIAVRVRPEDVDRAAEFYRRALGLEEKGRTDEGIELRRPNYTVWVDQSSEPVVLQEFIDPEGAHRSEFERAGCRIFDESEHGFHVADPFGMCFHVYTAKSQGEF